MREKTQIKQKNKNQISILNKPTSEQQTLQPKQHCSSYSPSLQLNSEHPKFSKPKEYRPRKLTQTQKIKHKNTRKSNLEHTSTNLENQTQLPPKFEQNTHKTINPTHLKLFLSENPLDRTLSPPHQPIFEQGENPDQQKS